MSLPDGWSLDPCPGDPDVGPHVTATYDDPTCHSRWGVWSFTPAEARQLARGLMAAADESESDLADGTEGDIPLPPTLFSIVGTDGEHTQPGRCRTRTDNCIVADCLQHGWHREPTEPSR